MEPTKLESKGSPSGLQRLLFRAPIWLYRARLGFLLGKRFCMIEHRGRKTGRMRRTVLEVVARSGGPIYVAAAWGKKAEWLKNLEADPHVVVHSAGSRYETKAIVIHPDRANTVLSDYADHHPKTLRSLARFMLEDPGSTVEQSIERIASSVPIVELPRPR
ncbi:MAG: nitroreductase family deazaflavin-dependent oxidoreductase [Acidimicrobiia bacterium]